jgi:ABC-2 type transport system permease protein
MGSFGVVRAAAKAAFTNKFTFMPPVLWAVQILVTSFFSMFFFTLLADYVGNPEVTVAYVAVGNAVQSVAMSTLYSVSEIPGIEKHTGTMGALMQSPAPLFTVFLGMSLFGISMGLVSMTVSLLFAGAVFGVSFGACNFVSVAAIIVLTCLSLAGMGMMLGSIGIHLRTASIIANLFAYVGLLICGVNFPVSYLPEWVQTISAAFPLTYAVEATRGAVDGASLLDLWQPVCTMVALGALYAVLAWLSFGYFEKMARRRGSGDSF